MGFTDYLRKLIFRGVFTTILFVALLFNNYDPLQEWVLILAVISICVTIEKNIFDRNDDDE